MLRTGVNPWGREGGIEAQRSDLWQLDLVSVINGIKDQGFVLEALGLSESDLPTKDDVAYYPQRISPPALRTKLRPVNHGTVPVVQPGYAEAVDPVRVQFTHDAESGKFSRIYALLFAWQQLARVGRRSTHGIYVPIPFASYRPPYRFDVVVRLIQGSEGEEGPEMVHGAAYLLEKCWLRAHQPGELSMSEASIHQITADLQPQNIKPWIAGPVLLDASSAFANSFPSVA